MIVAEHPIIITFACSRKIFVEAQQRKDSILWCLVICKFKKHWRYIDHCQRVTSTRETVVRVKFTISQDRSIVFGTRIDRLLYIFHFVFPYFPTVAPPREIKNNRQKTST